jgi:hypothetical protein
MPNKWHYYQEDQRGQLKWQRRGLLFSAEQHFLHAAGSRSDWFRSSQGSKDLCADSSIQKIEEGRPNSGLFACNRSKIFSRRLLKLIPREECKTPISELANLTDRRTTDGYHSTKKYVCWLLGLVSAFIRESPTNSREEFCVMSICEIWSPSTARRGSFQGAKSRIFLSGYAQLK